MNKFNIGDRVIKRKDGYVGEKGVITHIHNIDCRIEIKFDCILNVRRSNLVTWCSIDDIELDKEWYREEKLKELGI